MAPAATQTAGGEVVAEVDEEAVRIQTQRLHILSQNANSIEV